MDKNVAYARHAMRHALYLGEAYLGGIFSVSVFDDMQFALQPDVITDPTHLARLRA